MAALAGLVAMSSTSCSKDEIDVENGGIITLNVPAMPGFGEDAQSRIVFEDTGTKPIVKWVKGDEIYLGSINDVADNIDLKSLIDKGEFTTFRCVAVDEETGAATFQGTSIPADADMAVYSKIPDKVIKGVKDGSPSISCSATAIVPKSNADLTHLAENDLLVARFDKTTNKFIASTNPTNDNHKGQVFARVFGLYKFELTLPSGVSGTVKNLELSTVSTIGLSQPGKIDAKTDLPSASGTGNGYVVDCRNLTLQDNKLVCYALAARKGLTKDVSVLTLTLTVDEQQYKAEVIAKSSVMYDSAIHFNVNLQ